MEIWKPIEGFEGLYEISNLGRVKSVERKTIRLGFEKTICERFMKTPENSNGYKRVVLHKNSKPKTLFIHRLVATYFIKNPNNLPQVNHINGIKNDNRIENLEWVTAKGNSVHAIESGLTARGEKVSSSKLKSTDVLQIRQLAKSGIPRKTLASKFGICKEAIRDIINRKNWKHI